MTNRGKLLVGVAIGVLLILLVVLVFCIVLVTRERRETAIPKAGTSVPTVGMSGQVAPGPGKYWHHGDVLLPNPDLSPGDVRTTDADEVCNESAQDFRGTPESMKRRVYAKYDEAPHEGMCVDTTRMTKGSRRKPPHEVTESCEIDHIISLELGGADSEANLFPQPYNPSKGIGAHAKDKLENYLHDQVCHHGLPLKQAQDMIRKDWYQSYLDAHLN